ncbi:hypothetical protein KCV02_g23969, partial [Aureobasidium melanogenum]
DLERPHEFANFQLEAVHVFYYDIALTNGSSKKKAKRTAAGIPTWSPTVVLICRSTAYVWQSGRDAQFSADCGRTCFFHKLQW